MIFSEFSVSQIYFELACISKNQSSNPRGFNVFFLMFFEFNLHMNV